MPIYKLNIALECANEQEAIASQEVLKQLSAARVFTGSTLLKMYPVFQKNNEVLSQIFYKLSSGAGITSILPFLTKLKK